MRQLLADLVCDQNGASVVEYAILAAGLVLPMLAFYTVVSTSCGTVLSNTGSSLTSLGQNGQ